MTIRRALWTVAVAAILGACAGMPHQDPLQVTVAGLEPLPGEGFELRMMAKLRVQNPNDAPVDYNGVFVRVDVQGNTFATGVSDQRGSVPRYGESVIEVPLTASAMRMATFALGMLGGGSIEKIHYNLEGKLDGPGFGSTRFQSQGDLALPGAASPAARP